MINEVLEFRRLGAEQFTNEQLNELYSAMADEERRLERLIGDIERQHDFDGNREHQARLAEHQQDLNDIRAEIRRICEALKERATA